MESFQQIFDVKLTYKGELLVSFTTNGLYIIAHWKDSLFEVLEKKSQ